MAEQKDFATWFKMAIEERGYTQRSFSIRAGMDESTISNYCNGKRLPDARKIVRIMYALSGTDFDGRFQKNKKNMSLLVDSILALRKSSQKGEE